MKIAVFDVDGVLADFEGRLDQVLRTQFGEAGGCNRELYRLEDRYKGEVLDYALKCAANPNFYYGLREIEEGVLFSLDLVNNFELMYLSSRPESAETYTFRWLNQHTLVDNIARCGIADKASYLKSRSLTNGWDIAFVVDDNPDQIASLKAKGFKAFCWEQPWNQGVFPRLYTKGDGTLMLWEHESIEAQPFFEKEEALGGRYE